MSWRKAAVAAVGIALVGTLLSAPALGDLNGDKAKADQSVQQIKDQLEGTAADLVDAFTRLQATQAQPPRPTRPRPSSGSPTMPPRW